MDKKRRKMVFIQRKNFALLARHQTAVRSFLPLLLQAVLYRLQGPFKQITGMSSGREDPVPGTPESSFHFQQTWRNKQNIL
jgi:hypothetical protein